MFKNVRVFICTKMLTHSCRQMSACLSNISTITFCAIEHIDYIRAERSRYSIYIYEIRYYAKKNDYAFQFLRHASSCYSNHYQLKLNVTINKNFTLSIEYINQKEE